MLSFKTLLLKNVVMVILVMVLHGEMEVYGAGQATSLLTLRSKERQLKNKTKTDAPKKRKVRFTVRLQLPDLKMNQFLNDKSSPQHQQLTQVLTNDIQKLFVNTPGDQKVHNLQFSSYSGQYKEPGSLAEPSSWQKEIAIVPHSTDSKPLQFVLSTLSPSQSPTATVSKSKKGPARPNRKYSTETLKILSTSSPVKKSLYTTKTTRITTATSTNTATTTKAKTRSLAASSTTTISMKSTSEPGERVFDVVLMTRLFKECYTRDYLILLEPYLQAYSELLSIFKVLGPVFAFAGDDARSKLTKLHQLREQDIAKKQDNYATIQSMFAYEYSPLGAISELEGVSTNAWVHRVLKFISGIINAALENKSERSLGDKAQELYSEIMAPHHEWYIRAAAYLAFLSFPSRNSLMTQLGLTDSTEDRQALADLASAIDAVYLDVDSLYVKYSS